MRSWKDPGLILRREGGTVMAVRARWMIGVVSGVLLFAMAIQGLTPDYGNLASSWLLRLVSAWSMGGSIAGGAPSPRPAPPHGDDADVPGEIWGTVAAKAAVRIRLGDDGPLLVDFVPAGILGRTARPARRSPRPPSLAVRGPGGLLAALCRFLC